MKNKLKGTSKNSNFFVRARKHRAQNRSVYVIHEDSSTGLTPLSRKKCIFRGALKGFTLLEVLVALAIAGIGLAGVIKVAGGNIYNAQHLENKTIAQWVALNQIVQLRVTHKFPAIGNAKGDVEMADRKWFWQQQTTAVPSPLPEIKKTLRQVEVNVYADEDHKTGSLATVTTFIAQQ